MTYDLKYTRAPPEFSTKARAAGEFYRLATWIRENVPEEISYHSRESAVDVAIRLLETWRR